MTKRNLVLLAGVIGFGLSASTWAQQINSPRSLGWLSRTSALNPSMSLAEARPFPFGNATAWLAPSNNFLPDWRPIGWDSSGVNLSAAFGQPVRSSSISGYSKDSSKDVVSDLRKSNGFDYVHGEVGAFFGTSSGGRNSLTSEGGYIFAETGNDKVSIGVGAFYENTNATFRRGR